MVQLQATVAKDKSNWLKKNEEDAKIKYELEAAELYEKMGDFEKKRSKELQRTLKEFCNSQLFYHCHAVENWTKQKVSELDMEEWYACVDVKRIKHDEKKGYSMEIKVLVQIKSSIVKTLIKLLCGTSIGK